MSVALVGAGLDPPVPRVVGSTLAPLPTVELPAPAAIVVGSVATFDRRPLVDAAGGG